MYYYNNVLLLLGRKILSIGQVYHTIHQPDRKNLSDMTFFAH